MAEPQAPAAQQQPPAPVIAPPPAPQPRVDPPAPTLHVEAEPLKYAPPQAAPAKAPPAGDGDPPWLPERLTKAKAAAQNQLLNELGFPDVESAKKRLEAAKVLEEASLSEAERTAKRLAELEPMAARAAALEQRLAAVVESQFAGLTPEQQSAVDSVAQGDPERRLELISVLAAAGLTAAPPVPVTQTEATTPAATPPATTTPPGSPPAPAPTRTKFDEWQSLTDPIAKAIFLRLNKREIDATRPAAAQT